MARATLCEYRRRGPLWSGRNWAAIADRRARTMEPMRLASLLLRLSSIVFAVTGLAYLLVPGLALSVVGITSAATGDFLLRTEGVALLCGAGVLLAATDARPPGMMLALVSLALYYVLGSVVDLAAFAQGVVGPASVPSAAVRTILGGACLLAAARLTRASTSA
jgi:hypothetical protein